MTSNPRLSLELAVESSLELDPIVNIYLVGETGTSLLVDPEVRERIEETEVEIGLDQDHHVMQPRKKIEIQKIN